MIVIGDRQIHIEDLPWYIVVPGLYIITIIFGIIFEQYPRLMMQPSAADYEEGQLQCSIYRQVSVRPHGNYLNVTLNVSALNDISVNQSWMSIRLRVTGRLATEVLRSNDAIKVQRLDKTQVTSLYETSLDGTVNVELFCSDILLHSVTLDMPERRSSKYTYFRNNSIHNVCLQSNSLRIFSQRLLSPAPIYHYNNVIERGDPESDQMSSTKLILMKFEDSALIDSLASAVHTVAKSSGSKGVVFGEIAGVLAKHPLFIGTANMCTRELKIADNIKSVSDFDASDYDLVRKNLLESPHEAEKALVLEMNESIQIDEFNGSSRVSVAELTGEILLNRFGRVETLVIAFDAPLGILAFVPKQTTVLVAKPRSVTDISPLEEKAKHIGVQVIYW